MAGDVQICAKCENSLKNRENESIVCEQCKKSYHNSCMGISNTAFNHLRKIKGALWFCDTCGDEKDLLKNVYDKLLRIETLLSEHSNKLQVLEQKASLQTFVNRSHNALPIPTQKTPIGSIKRSFATALQDDNNSSSDSAKKRRPDYSEMSTPKRVLPKMKNAIIIKQKPGQNIDTPIKNTVKPHLNRETDRVTGLKETKSGNILIECETAEACKALREKLEPQMQDYNINQTSEKFWPRFTIVNVEKYMDDDSFVSSLKEENAHISDDAVIKVIKVIENAKNKTSKIIIECDLPTGDILRKKREIVIDWDICPVYPYVGLTRCYKCYNYGHIANECKGEKACSKCGENHEHASSNCTKTEFTCVNCVRFNNHLKEDELSLKLNVRHPVFSASCPIYKQKMQKKMSRMTYIA